MNKVIEILKIFEKHNYKAYLVGGAVRDYLLEINPTDYDITTEATPEEVFEIFKEKCDMKYSKYGVVYLKYFNTTYEITSFRIESKYTDKRHPENIIFTKNYKEDLKRRDFTINAILLNSEKEIIDEYNGVNDLKSKLIKTIRNPFLRINEDSLRILRGLSLVSKYGFDVELLTKEAFFIYKDSLKMISKEVLKKEIRNIFNGKYFSKVLKEYSHILDSILEVFKDFSYNFENIEFFDNNSLVFKVFCLYFNKIACFREVELLILNKNEINLLINGLNSINLVDLSKKTGIIDAFSKFSKENEPYLVLKLVNDFSYFSKDIDYYEYLRRSDLIYELKNFFKLTSLKINGNDLKRLGINDGVKIKEILTFLLNEVNLEKVLNNYEDLVEYLRKSNKF